MKLNYIIIRPWYDAPVIALMPAVSPAQIKKKEAWEDDEKPP